MRPRLLPLFTTALLVGPLVGPMAAPAAAGPAPAEPAPADPVTADPATADPADGADPVRSPFPDSTDLDFLNGAVEAANARRARHGAPPLDVDGELNAYALERAREFSEYEGLDEAHRGRRPGHGETVHYSASTDPEDVPTAQDAVDSWYSGNERYDYADPGFSSDTGQFTQLVWRSTTKVGAARVSGPSAPSESAPGSSADASRPSEQSWNEHYIVFVYTPPGNMRGEYEENVLPPEG